METVRPQPKRIQYRLIKLELSEKLPPVAPAGPGGRPGVGSPAARLPALGSTASRSSITVVSKPAHPDNPRQTLYQSLSPPDLRITVDLKLPNVFVGTPAIVPRPQIHFNPNDSRSARPRHHIALEPVPSVVLTDAAAPAINLADLSSPQPHLPVPPASPAKATGTPVNTERLPRTDGAVPVSGEASDLVIVGTDASDPMSLLTLPLGNRWGEFVTSSAREQPGPLEGSSGVVGGKGSGGSGPGGDLSMGIGIGKAGGGGKTGSPGVLSLNGTPGRIGDSGSFDPSLVATMVYPVPSSVLPRKNALVVTAGPVGGGGLDAYGTLHCGKIYTVFLQMPGKDWTLQYCRSANSAEKPKSQAGSNVVHLEQGLVPPDAESRFDFRRLPVPQQKKHRMIVLKGVITEEGTVDNLQIYQSILPEMDEAARLAFSRWKFKPALREGKPVAVEILIGIPSEAPRAHSPN